MTTLFSKKIDFDQPFQRLRLRSFRPFWGGTIVKTVKLVFMTPKNVLMQNFVFTVLFGHNLDPLDH